MTVTKEFKELTNTRSIVLKNKHIAILTKHKIKDLNVFIQTKIEELEPEEIDETSQMISDATKEVKTDIENIADLKYIKEEKDIRIF